MSGATFPKATHPKAAHPKAARPAAGALFAVCLTAAAFGATYLLKGIVSTAGYIFFYIAVVASAWFLGKWPGRIAVILSALTVAYFFLPPVNSFKINREFIPIFIEFAVSSAVVSWFSSWRRHAENELRMARDELQARVEERTAELRQTNEKLLAEIAERKRAEDAYYEAQAEIARVTRMSALGALAASISHEVNQPLAAVVANADACMMWLSAEPPNVEEARTAVDRVAHEGTRASDVVRGIRALFTQGVPQRTPVQVNDLLREVSDLISAEAFRHQVQVVSELDPDLPIAMADRTQIHQVIVNLVQNGIEAMLDVADRPRMLVIRSEAIGADRIAVLVRDSGGGIEAKNERRMFDVYFTTKARGMGMGLAISRSIVEAHGGRLWASNNEDRGATLQFTLPVERDAEGTP
jgi:C4-dicarboxylate-specific signal transduction histidine kinase